MADTIEAKVPVEVPTPPAKITFGFKSLFRPTPELASHIFNVVLAIAAVLVLVTQCYPQIPQSIKGQIAEYSVQTLAFVRLISKMFGIKISDIDVENVK